jgi:hypothetical protein
VTSFGTPTAPWPIRWTCDISTVSPVLTGYAAMFATEVIHDLSGRQFGTTRLTLRPCRRSCADDAWTAGEWLPGQTSYPSPALINGRWFNLTCGTCWGTCSCTTLSEVKLPNPVSAIVAVKIDGSTIPVTGYMLQESQLLIRTGGNVWPLCNDLSRPDTAVGTWSVTFDVGRAIPEGAAWAVGELACEIIRGANGEDCRLPRNVTNIARQGVTITLPDITSLFGQGLTGLPLVDMWISSVNPQHMATRSQVYRVDAPVARQVN